MKSLQELIDTKEPGWELVQHWIRNSNNPIEILPRDPIRAEQALYQTQVTTHSPMGAIIYETGGLLVDHGWIRVLGSGCKKMDRSLPEWNEGKTFTQSGEQPTYLLIADDVIGGFYAINNGGLAHNEGIGSVFYFAPDTMEWENMEIGYSDFITFCCTGDIAGFYESFRWKNWQADVAKLNGMQGFSCLPFLFTKEGKNINSVSKRPVSIAELWSLQQDLQRQLNHG
ncbi:DUF2625 domain-containing protein [Chitinophaga sp. 30R24]|uniref:DUF2625 domain-containing protein n=1 Tax=Chitinophaga sp. 30R24 TaxID=3248838 RepID=UPI003B90AAC8